MLILMCENGKMRPVETVPGVEGVIKENGRVGEFKYDIMVRTFTNVIMYPEYYNKIFYYFPVLTSKFSPNHILLPYMTILRSYI
jgi:hypothetical protein